MFDLLGLAVIAEASGKLPHDTRALFGLAQQHGTAVGGDRAAIETGHHLAAAVVGEGEAGLGTLCQRSLSCWLQHLVIIMFMPQKAAFRHPYGEKSGLRSNMRSRDTQHV